jgi:hypothetical protein
VAQQSMIAIDGSGTAERNQAGGFRSIGIVASRHNHAACNAIEWNATTATALITVDW